MLYMSNLQPAPHYARAVNQHHLTRDHTIDLGGLPLLPTKNPRVTWIKQRQGLFPLDGDVLLIRFVSSGFDITFSGTLAAATNLIWTVFASSCIKKCRKSIMNGRRSDCYNFFSMSTWPTANSHVCIGSKNTKTPNPALCAPQPLQTGDL